MLFVLHTSTKSQLTPVECSVLNYRLIGFSIPAERQVNDYSIEIASGSFDTEDLFRKNIIETVHSKGNKIIAEVPSFGSQYTWQVVYTTPATKSRSVLHHFSTGIIPEVDTSNIRLRIKQQSLKFKDAYIFLDQQNILYDMHGKPIWYLPLIEGQKLPVTDLKLSPRGTITFLGAVQAYEVNYDGGILWKAPNDAKIGGHSGGNYHHEFTRLSNGHYMILGNEDVSCNSLIDSSFRITINKETQPEKNAVDCIRLPFGTLVEYDAQGNVVWSWKSSKYYEESDLANYPMTKNMPLTDIHPNAFYFDEKNHEIYVSFKTISRLIKIDYPSGNVSGSYGEIYKPFVPVKGNSLFCAQHGLKMAKDGSLFLFNNNVCNPGAFPKIEKLKAPFSRGEKMKITWEFECNNDAVAPKGFTTGGNVIELPGNALFVSMANPGSNIFIVNMEKKILWSAVSERWDEGNKVWNPLPLYRASIIIDREKMEQLIWNSGKYQSSLPNSCNN